MINIYRFIRRHQLYTFIWKKWAITLVSTISNNAGTDLRKLSRQNVRLIIKANSQTDGRVDVL